MNKSKVTVDNEGVRRWFLDGKLHREDGPAVELVNGDRVWYLNDEPHREDGPAVEYADGGQEWWLNGKEMSESEHLQAVLLAKWGLTA